MEFRHAGIVCGLFRGTNKAYVLDAKELNGDIVSNVDDAIIFLKKHLRISFKIEGLRRENILELPEDGLREAVVNAACHRNYFENGSRIMVEIYDDRVDIVSPGGVCKGITPENFGTVSITRNPLVQSMFYRIDYIEQMGTGIMRMKEAAKEANVAEPQFELENFFRVTFKRTPLNTQAIPSDTQAILSDTQATLGNGSNGGNGGINGGNHKAVLDILRSDSAITTTNMSKQTGIPIRTVERVVAELKKDGLVERIGSKKTGYWRIIE